MHYWLGQYGPHAHSARLLNIKLMEILHKTHLRLFSLHKTFWCLKCFSRKCPRFRIATLPTRIKVFCNPCAGYGPDGDILTEAELDCRTSDDLGFAKATSNDLVFHVRHLALQNLRFAGSKRQSTYADISARLGSKDVDYSDLLLPTSIGSWCTESQVAL